MKTLAKSQTRLKARTKAAYSPAHQQAASVTLMRRAVAKPNASFRHRIKAVSSVSQANQAKLTLSPTSHNLTSKPHRQSLTKSPAISHYSRVRPDDQAQFKPALGSGPAVNNFIGPTKKPALKPRTSADVLERALSQAVAHEQRPLPNLSVKKRRKLASLWIVSAASVIIVGVVVSQNMTSIRLQFADAKAGFSASLPRDMPPGYSFAKLAYQPGIISTVFKSNSGSASYNIVQRTTLWDNQDLKNDFVVAMDPHYASIKSGGTVVYLYGNHNAAWINNGIWYNIQSNGALSDSQLITMASSS